MQSTRLASKRARRMCLRLDGGGSRDGRTVGGDEAGHALGGEVMDEVVHPSEIGVAPRHDAILPAHLVVCFGMLVQAWEEGQGKLEAV